MRCERFCGFVKNYSLPAQRSGKISFESQPRNFAFALPASSSSRRVCGIAVQSDTQRYKEGDRMGKNISFKCAFDSLRPLLKSKAKSGEFVASIINMGLKPEVKDKDGNFVKRRALKIVAASPWKSYTNGNREISQPVASDLAGRWESNRFEQNRCPSCRKRQLTKTDAQDTVHLCEPIELPIIKGNTDTARILLRATCTKVRKFKEPSLDEQTQQVIDDHTRL